MWLPFDLHPEYPPEGIPLAELHRRYGFGENDPLSERFAAAGLKYNRPEIVPNTKLALRATELAREQGLHESFHDRLMEAYWSEATNIGDPEELRRLASEMGLDGEDVDAVIADPAAYLDAVEGSTRQAHAIGINAVPAFVLDRQLIVLGACRSSSSAMPSLNSRRRRVTTTQLATQANAASWHRTQRASIARAPDSVSVGRQ